MTQYMHGPSIINKFMFMSIAIKQNKISVEKHWIHKKIINMVPTLMFQRKKQAHWSFL